MLRTIDVPRSDTMCIWIIDVSTRLALTIPNSILILKNLKTQWENQGSKCQDLTESLGKSHSIELLIR
jgi:hypothetical protein